MIKSIFLLALALLLQTCDVCAQPLSIVPSPTGFDTNGEGLYGIPVHYGGSKYFFYVATNGRHFLGKVDGTTLTIIPNPTGMEYGGHPIVYGGFLYLKYQSTSTFDSYLVRWDGATFTFLNNPSGYGSRGYQGWPVIFQGDLLMQFETNGNRSDLMRFNGSAFFPLGITGYDCDMEGTTIIGNELFIRYGQATPQGNGFLGKFNGSTVSIIPNPPGYTFVYCGLISKPGFELNGKLHMRYLHNSGQYTLMRYDGGNVITEVPVPPGHSYVDDFSNADDPYLFLGKAFLRMKDGTGAFYLGEYDGNALTSVASPTVSQANGQGYTGYPIGIDSTLFLRYTAPGTAYLAKYESSVLSPVAAAPNVAYIGLPESYNGFVGKFTDGTSARLAVSDGDTVRLVPHPATFNSQWGMGYSGTHKVHNGYLYTAYDLDGSGSHLFRFDGSTLFMIPNSKGGRSLQEADDPIWSQGPYMYMRMEDMIGNYDLGILDTCGHTTATIAPVRCGSYTAPDGQIYTTSGTYQATVANTWGCDSLITINLSILQPTNSTIFDTVCSQYTAPDGQVYDSSGTYIAILQNTVGCDSIITIHLAVNPANLWTTSTIAVTACDQYVAPDGQTYTASGAYTAIIPNAAGCDSLINVQLTVHASTSSSITTTACHSYTGPTGQVYYSTGNFTATIPNAIGCDSVITIHLTIPVVNTNVTVFNPTLTCNAGGNLYQWLDCNAGFQPIPGATGQSYTAVTNGSYAVQVTASGCTDTSQCHTIVLAGVQDGPLTGPYAYPNPATTEIFLKVDEPMDCAIYSSEGRIMWKGRIDKYSQLDVSHWASAIYLVLFKDATGRSFTHRVAKIAVN